MPNYVTNIMQFYNKADYEKAKELWVSITENGTEEVDFDKVIPIHEDLDITSGSCSWLKENRGYNELAWNTQEKTVKPLLDTLYTDTITQKEFTEKAQELLVIQNNFTEIMTALNFMWKTETGEKKLQMTELAEYIKGYFNLRRYGYIDSYTAHIELWDTKWNACDSFVDDNRMQFTFDTAWSMPYNVIQALVDKGIHNFYYAYADEDTGSNLGVFQVDEQDGVNWLLQEKCRWSEKSGSDRMLHMITALLIRGHDKEYIIDYFADDNYYTDSDIKRITGLNRKQAVKKVEQTIKTVRELLKPLIDTEMFIK